MSTPILTATDGEVYVVLADTTQVFPAIIDDWRWNGFAVPRFRRAVAVAVAQWLNEMHDQDPDAWPDTARFDGDVLTVLETEEDRPERIEPDEHDRYAIGYRGWCWELTAPTSDAQSDAALLADRERLAAENGEILFTIDIDGTAPVFPALAVETCGQGVAGCPRFRRAVAEVVVAWISDSTRKDPDGCDSAYWDGETIVLLHRQDIDKDGYLPARISAAEDGRYSIAASFAWERVD